jgi:hypothetical protein
MVTQLRLGLLLDSVFLPAWAFTAIKRILSSKDAGLALIILNQSQPKGGSLKTIFWQDTDHLLYQIFNAVDEKLFIHGQNALTPVNAAEMFSNVPTFQVKPVSENGAQYFSPSDIEQIRSYQLDILVKIGFGNLQGNVLYAANCGVWAYRWGDYRKIEDGLTSFWETVKSWPETGVALQKLGIDDAHHNILFESWFFTYPFSPARSRNYVLWAASRFLPRQVERLHRLGKEKYFQELACRADKFSTTLEQNGAPSNLTVLWIMTRMVAKNLAEVYRRSFYRDQWCLLFDLEHNKQRGKPAFKKMFPPRDRFWADPHVIYKEPNYYVFIEEYLYKTRRGHISVIEIDRDGNYKQPVPVLRNDCHLSFPFVFEWMGNYYMIPETSGKRTIELYECVHFPDEWKFKITLMKDVDAVDTTLFYLRGKWWLFTAISEEAAAVPQVELFLFYSNELFTDQWYAHPLNPIVSDVKRTRAAGSIFVKDGMVFRPSQDCSKMYGYGFDLNEIVALSEKEYYERTVISVRPDQFSKVIATHTYANQGNLTVIDALTRFPKWAKAV